MGSLSMQDIIEVNDMELEELEVEEWGGSVYLGSLSLSARINYEEKHRNDKGTIGDPNDTKYIIDLLQMTLRDENGSFLFPKEEDSQVLASKKDTVILRLFKACSEHHSIDKGDIEDIKKKSEPVQQDCSCID